MKWEIWKVPIRSLHRGTPLYGGFFFQHCIACGLCADERCPMGAIDSMGDYNEVNPARCIGCGVCVVTCPSGALSLQRKAEEQIDLPPDNIIVWTMEKAQKTGRTMEGLI